MNECVEDLFPDKFNKILVFFKIFFMTYKYIQNRFTIHLTINHLTINRISNKRLTSFVF